MHHFNNIKMSHIISFRKYQFPDQQTWETIYAQIDKEDMISEVTVLYDQLPEYLVDILWNKPVPVGDITQYEIDLPTGTGLHTFAGIDYQEYKH